MGKAEKYDMSMAYNKNLRPSARLHYLENARHDKDTGAAMYKKSPATAKCGPHMESAKQERVNLMKDMPVDNRATGVEMYDGPAMKGTFMSKHCNCR